MLFAHKFLFIWVWLLASLVEDSNELFCGGCPSLLRGACCSFSYPSCCPFKPGACPTPVPDIPQPGIYAVLCSGDQSCSGWSKCCSIRQASTGQLFQICQNPAPVNTTG